MGNGMLFDTELDTPQWKCGVVPREYQMRAVEETYRLWNEGERGVLLRMFTGAGKTITASMIASRWLDMDESNNCMIISYEKQLTWQFAEEVEDVLMIKPGIEMAEECVSPERVPKIVVASRQTLQLKKPISEAQRQFFHDLGIDDETIALCTFSQAKALVSAVKRHGADASYVADELRSYALDYRCDHQSGNVSRLHKFDWKNNWLVVYDEAHKHVHQLKSVGHVVDWFDQNPKSRRLGLTATPKRSDGISIGAKMFPGVAIDYPLYLFEGECAVRSGYAVPYIQKFVQVEAIDFANIKALAGNSQEKWDAEVARILETQLATYCEPTLDMVEDRRTLIFSPSVEMAKLVRDYINARAKIRCKCGKTQWHPKSLVGDGAQCSDCGKMLCQDDAMQTPDDQCMALWGEIPHGKRKPIYEGHQRGSFQFLSVCNLCREAYNDPDISCVAIFRPVSRKASSLAEQMKGRGSRPERGCIDGLDTNEDRVEAIRRSGKPNCLIIDLVGVTGLGDCASTFQIYAEGLDDEIVARAEELSFGGVEDVREAIEKATEEVAAERERRRLERERVEREAREAAKRRAAARAKARYTTHDVGYETSHDPLAASEKQMRYLHYLGMDIFGMSLSKRQAGRMISMLQEGKPLEQVADQSGIHPDYWAQAEPTKLQRKALMKAGLDTAGMTPKEASDAIDAHKTGRMPATAVMNKIRACTTSAELDSLSRQVKTHWKKYSHSEQQLIRQLGTSRREEVTRAST